MKSEIGRRIGVSCLAGMAFLVLQGCAYVRHRGEDAAQMFDIGLTLSQKPHLSIYACGGGIVGLGAGRCDGSFVGWGGDQVGMTRHYHRNVGLVPWTYNEVGWGEEFEPDEPDTLNRAHNGLLGWMMYPARKPGYGVACVHYLHLGWVGIALNARYEEILDFFLGWTTLDFCGDDGKKLGEADWAWWEDNPRPPPDIHQPNLPF